MKRFSLALVLTLGLMILGASCAHKTDTAEGTKEKKGILPKNQESLGKWPIPSLKEVYKDYFPVGAAISTRTIRTHRSLLLKHFDSVTAEYQMKLDHLYLFGDVFSFSNADFIVDFARQNKMRVRGHTLIWHKKAPEWFFKGSLGKPLNRDILLKKMEKYIKTVVGHFKGKVYCWDVVNEAITDDVGTFRRSKWLKYIGEDYIEKAFRWAHEADPTALLFYNDYNATVPEKRRKIYNLVKRLKKKGVPIHGVGIQGHWTLDWPSVYDLKSAVEKYASLGVEVQITELDLSVYAWGDSSRRYDRLPDKLEDRQGRRYKVMFDLFRKYRDTITSVTLWGVADDATWLDHYPITGRKNWPLLFDAQHKPKKGFWQIVDFSNQR